ncbi:OpgC domain-containing protein [Xanthobacter oligotrophicus]|uniref:OpgC domain-containing protein n=1 Tax=Xanthobacter oligotrophicus TaxID=2607286 RepID=A0ABW6ZW42_9HYPH
MTGAEGRLLSIDFWRGFALLTIFVNHVPGHVLSFYTHRNFGVSDAAELFVLLAGISAAFAYLRPFAPGGRVRTTARIVLRAFSLYVAHLALVIMAIVVVGGFVVLTGDSRMLEWLHLDLVQASPIEALVGMGLLTYQPAYLNILPLYVAVLLMAPVLLLLARFSLRLMLAVSFAFYLLAQFADLSPPVWPGSGWWFFNPFAWQLLFACGLALGALIDRGLKSAAHPVLDVLAPLYLFATLVWVLLGFPASLEVAPLPAFVWDFDKTNLALPRVLHVLALAYCVSRLPVERWLKAKGHGAPLILMGRHALPVFCLGTVLSLAAQVTRPLFDGALAFDLLILVVAFTLQWSLAWVLEWQGQGRARAPQGAMARSAPARTA